MTEESTNLSTNLYAQAFSVKTQINTVNDLFKKIVDIMTQNRVCGNNNNLRRKLNINAIDRILKTTTNSLPAMKALECMFDDRTFQSQLSRDIISTVNPKKQWLTKGRKISAGTYGETFVATLDSTIKFVCKLPLGVDKNAYIDATIEYFIGAAVINNFRKFCPNFCYTLGTFNCNYTPNPVYLCTDDGVKKLYNFYEHINGIPLEKIDTPVQFLVMVVQLLLALELAQRENRFFHNDVNMSNIMVTDEIHKFNIILDNHTFTFNSRVAVFIDYGMSCATVNGMTISSLIGKHGIPFIDIYNRLPFLLQGVDTAMLFAHAALSCNSEVKHFAREIMQLVYGDLDPYKIASRTSEDIMKEYYNDYFGGYATSRIASITPQQVLDMILANPQMMSMLSKNLTITNHNSTTLPMSVYAFYKEIYGTDFKTDMSCIGEIDSYMLAHEVLVSAAHSNIQSQELGALHNKIRDSEDAMIAVDMRMLEDFFTIDVSEKVISEQVLPLISRILSMRYKNPKDPSEEIDYPLIDQFKQSVNFMDMLEKYNSIFVKIRTLNIQNDMYGDMYRRFLGSEQYFVYIRDGKWIRAGLRWAETLSKLTTGITNPELFRKK